jgi:hypothetical protein
MVACILSNSFTSRIDAREMLAVQANMQKILEVVKAK